MKTQRICLNNTASREVTTGRISSQRPRSHAPQTARSERPSFPISNNGKATSIPTVCVTRCVLLNSALSQICDAASVDVTQGASSVNAAKTKQARETSIVKQFQTRYLQNVSVSLRKNLPRGISVRNAVWAEFDSASTVERPCTCIKNEQHNPSHWARASQWASRRPLRRHAHWLETRRPRNHVSVTNFKTK